jgi:FixJ family two-component response regulator
MCDPRFEANRSRLPLRQRTTTVKDVVISIIDDDAAARSAIVALMRAKGFEARSYESAEDFLQSDASELSRCIITDIQMPGLSGIELKQQLDATNCRTPVIMITARVEPRLHSLALASGAFCLLRKPFKASELIECVERALTR